MRPVLVIATAVALDAVRRKVVWVVLLFAVLLSFAVPALPSYGVGVVDAVFREVSIALMYVAALVVSLALAALRIPAEVERRTVFNVLSRDVARWKYVFGTWSGMFLIVGVAIAAFCCVAAGIGLAVYREWMPILFTAGFAVWLEMGVLMAVTVLASTRFGAVTSIVVALAFAFIGHAVTGLVAQRFGESPWWVPSLDVFNVINPVAHGSGYSLVYAVGMLVVFVGWVGLLLLGASSLFSLRDL